MILIVLQTLNASTRSIRSPLYIYTLVLTVYLLICNLQATAIIVKKYHLEQHFLGRDARRTDPKYAVSQPKEEKNPSGSRWSQISCYFSRFSERVAAWLVAQITVIKKGSTRQQPCFLPGSNTARASTWPKALDLINKFAARRHKRGKVSNRVQLRSPCPCSSTKR